MKNGSVTIQIGNETRELRVTFLTILSLQRKLQVNSIGSLFEHLDNMEHVMDFLCEALVGDPLSKEDAAASLPWSFQGVKEVNSAVLRAYGVEPEVGVDTESPLAVSAGSTSGPSGDSTSG